MISVNIYLSFNSVLTDSFGRNIKTSLIIKQYSFIWLKGYFPENRREFIFSSKHCITKAPNLDFRYNWMWQPKLNILSKSLVINCLIDFLYIRFRFSTEFIPSDRVCLQSKWIKKQDFRFFHGLSLLTCGKYSPIVFKTHFLL